MKNGMFNYQDDSKDQVLAGASLSNSRLPVFVLLTDRGVEKMYYIPSQAQAYA